MSHNTVIKTTKIIYPQIYAYTLPTIQDYNGWVKIGYTERKNVDERIKEQTKTAAINLAYDKLWSEPAKFNTSDDWFKDKQLHTYLRRYKNIEQRTNTEWFFYNGTPEKSHADFNDFRNNERSQVKEKLQYTLRNEQEDAVNMTLDYAKKYKGGEFLWNAKPRFGKTLTTYDFIRKLDASKVLIVTNRPAIANSWFDDFEKFIAWQTDYAFVSTSDSLKDRPVMDQDEFTAQMMDGKNKMLAFISLQDLKGAISFGGSHDKLKWVKDLEWDLLVIDESHEGVDTFKTDIAFENIKSDFTLHLSGTPFKAVASGKFSDYQIYNWTYADEQEAKADWPIESEENNPYEKLPRLSLFSYQMSQMITDEVNKGAEIDGENIDYAFDLNEFFETNDTGKFIHEADIKKWLDSLSHNEKYPFSTKELRAELKHTFWLLNRVASAKALEKLLKNHRVFDSYEIILAAGDGRTSDDQIINQKSLDRVRDAIAENDRTITLSVGQLTTGVTVPEWTAVLMLSNMKSPSLYMQAAFRAQNPWEYEVNGEMHQKEKVIPAIKRVRNNKNYESKPKTRVAAYCRVSTDSDEQASSYEVQIAHYTEFIKKNAEWELAGIFADDGISGTNTKKREEFNRMIEDCMAGKIDMIITKSISRFARNTLDCLKYIRQLKDKNIAVFFEKENINTMDSKGEIMLTIMASLAQQESQSLSQNVKLGIQYRYQQGEVQVNHKRFLGYTKDENKHLIIEPKGAEIVKRIYREYLEGASLLQIARGLEADGVLTAAGKAKWRPETLKKILQNEKYIGDALLQKTYTVDFLSKKRVKNNGIVPQYYVENSHDPIISRDLYMRVQEEMVRRVNLRSGKSGKKRVYSSKYALSSIVYCGQCGDIYRRVHWNNRGCKSIVWRCVSRLEEKGSDCTSQTIKEEVLQEAVVKAINKLLGNKETFIQMMQKNIMTVLNQKNDDAINNIDGKLEELQKQLLKQAKSKNNYNEVADEIYRLRELKQNALVEDAEREGKRQRIDEITDFLNEQSCEMLEYDEQLVRRLIEKITVLDTRFEVEFKSGVSVDVQR